MKKIMLGVILLGWAASGCAAQSGSDTATQIEALRGRLKDHEAESEKSIRTLIEYIGKLEKRVKDLEVDLETMKMRVAMLGEPDKNSAENRQNEQQKMMVEKQSEDVATQVVRGTMTVDAAVKDLMPHSKHAVPVLIRILKKLRENLQFDEARKMEALLSKMPLEDIKASIPELAKDMTLRLSALTLVEAFGDYELSRGLEPFLSSPDEGFRVLVGLALVKCKNKVGIPVLIQAIKKSDHNSKMAFFQLEKVAGQNFGYSILNTPEQSQEAVKRWEDWWQKKGPAFKFQ